MEERLYEDVRYDIGKHDRVLLIGTHTTTETRALSKEHLDELEMLAETYGFEVVAKESIPLRKIDISTYIGKGKSEELIARFKEVEADLVLFDDELSPGQERNLEKAFNAPVIDRTELILEIFHRHARTKEAKLQVELAQSSYRLPRLKRLWTHLSRQVASGKGFLKGEGERQIELDRRLVRAKITRLKRELHLIERRRSVRRKARLRSRVPTFAIVGYTNSGKSTLLRALTHADVLVEDKLFATLDTKTCRFTLPNGREALLVDTVGFIRKIPHTIVAAFRSTLEEALHTDVLIRLVDVSHPAVHEHVAATDGVLRELGAQDKRTITVLNKIDLLEDRSISGRFKLTYPRVVAVSATEGTGLDELADVMIETLAEQRERVRLRIPQKEYVVFGKLAEEGHILYKAFEDNDILVDVEIPPSLRGVAEPFRIV
ncbi:MAG: GTPase HflX [Simkaniaceae bacterium]|nr:GTPase HflX [Simkaniaceae bacterium]